MNIFHAVLLRHRVALDNGVHSKDVLIKKTFPRPEGTKNYRLRPGGV
jgi:hypothetical protein